MEKFIEFQRKNVKSKKLNILQEAKKLSIKCIKILKHAIKYNKVISSKRQIEINTTVNEVLEKKLFDKYLKVKSKKNILQRNKTLKIKKEIKIQWIFIVSTKESKYNKHCDNK